MIKSLEEALKDEKIRKQMEKVDAKDSIITARVQTLFKFGFFSQLLLRLNIEENPSIDTMATDGKRIMYNPDYVRVDTVLNPLYVMSDLVHETLHNALGHPFLTDETKDYTLLNIATDIVVDSKILLSGLPIPPWSVILHIDPFTGEHFDEPIPESKVMGLVQKYVQMGTLEIYDLLAKNLKQQMRQQLQSMYGASYGTGQNSSSQGQQGTGNSNNQGQQSRDKHPTGIHSHSMWEQVKNDENLMLGWRENIITAIMSQIMSRGDVPAGFEREYQILNRNKFPWKQMLYKFLHFKPVDYMMPPYNKKTLPFDIPLPVERTQALENIVIAIDTSGSIDYDSLSKFMSEVNYILSVHPNSSGYIATCDADVYEMVHFEGKIDLNQVKIHGGGGTDFRPLFKKIEEKNIRPSVMVFFTDGDATYPEEAPKYPVMFVIKSKYNKPAPFGISVFFREGENYDVL